MTALRYLILFVAFSLPAAAQDTKKLVDPPKVAPAALADQGKDIALPEKVTIPEVAFAAQHSPFVLFGGREGARFKHQIVNLKDGSVAATIDNADLGKFALSPDGNLIACMGSSGRTHGVRLYDVKAKKVLKTIDIGQQGDDVEFIDADRFYTVQIVQKKITVWSVADGKAIHTIPIEPRLGQPIAVTPGGAWLVLADKSRITAHPVAGGAEVKVADVPKVGPFEAAPKALAVSADGARLAAFFDDGGKRHLLIVRLATGAATGPIEIAGDANWGYRGPSVLGTPDSLGWLIQGRDMLEVESGKPIWSVPKEKTPDRMATPVAVNQVFALREYEKKIVAASVPKDRVAAMAAVAKAGGDARDALKTKLTTPDRTGAKVVAVPLGNVPWNAAPSQAANAAKLAPRPFAGDVFAQQCGSLALSSVEGGVLAMERKSQEPMARDKGAVAISLYNLVTGQSLGQIPLPGPGLLQSVAPDGKSFLVLDGEQQDRLDLYAADGRTLAAWKPYDADKVKFAGIVDAGLVLTMSARGSLAVWSVPEVKAVATAEAATLQIGRFTPDRKHFAAHDGETVRFFDARTLEPRGDGAAATDRRRGTPHAIAFNAAGTEIAALVVDAANPIKWFIQRWDLKSGQALGRVEFTHIHLGGPNSTAAVQYAGQYFLIDNRMLYDPAAKETAWSYMSGNLHGSRVFDSPDERLWYTAGEMPDKPACVVAAAIPGDALAATLAEVRKSTDFVLPPGSAVKVSIDAAGDRYAAVADKLKANAVQSVKAQGHAPGDAGDFELAIKIEEKDLNDTAEYRMIGQPGTITVHLWQITVTAKLTRNGQPVWKSASAVYGMRQFFVHVPAKETNIEEFLRKQMWEAVAGWARSLPLPKRIVRTPAGVVAWPGSSTLTADGPKASLGGVVP